MTRSAIPYTRDGLDRAAHRRKDAAWLAARLADPATGYLVLWRNSHQVLDGPEGPTPAVLDGSEATLALELAAEIVFLGWEPAGRDPAVPASGRALFALDLSPLEADEVLQAVGGRGHFSDLRALGPGLSLMDGTRLAYVRALFHWHERHRYCGRCGRPTETVEGGHARICTEGDCGITQFPRTDPAVIMLVHDGGDRCVLGHNPRMPPGMHSTLAGFVEPGEDIEGAVIREVAEEVGLRVPRDGLRYFGAQPWPFPGSLMLGFFARAEPGALTVDPAELASADWFHRDWLRASPEDESFRLPRADSIAALLIRTWLDREV